MVEKINFNSITPPPPHTSFENILLEICGHLRCRFTKNSPRRIRSGTDAAGSKLQQVFRQKNLSLYSVHGRTLYNIPAGVFCALLASASPISKRLTETLFLKAFILYGCITASALSFFFVFFILFLENLRRHLPILICIISQSTPRVRFVSINSPHD